MPAWASVGLLLFAGCGASSQESADPDTVHGADQEPAADISATDMAPEEDSHEYEADQHEATLWTAHMVLPQWPFFENGGLVVSQQRLELLGNDYCGHVDGKADAAEFFYNYLPLRAVASLCLEDPQGPEVNPDTAEVRELLGLMYLSGYYGGVWFRDNADFGMGMPSGEEQEPGHGSGPVTEEQFMPLAENAADLVSLAASGEAVDVVQHNFEALVGTGALMDALMSSLLTIFAYNYGYVQAVLAKPPEQVTQKPSFPCRGYLDCRLGESALSRYAAFEKAFPKLKEPPDERWSEVSAEVEKSKQWVSIGKGLWSEGSISPEAWEILVQINAGYLQVSAAAALGSAIGFSQEDERTARCAVLLEAAADVWNQAYFLALRSDAPEGAYPELQCVEMD